MWPRPGGWSAPASVFFVAMSLLVAVAGYLGTAAMLRLLGTPPDALPYAVAYLRIIFVALPSMYFYSFLMMTLRGAGDSKTPFLFMGLSVLLDIGLNPLLMFGIGPFPEAGHRRLGHRHADRADRGAGCAAAARCTCAGISCGSAGASLALLRPDLARSCARWCSRACRWACR